MRHADRTMSLRVCGDCVLPATPPAPGKPWRLIRRRELGGVRVRLIEMGVEVWQRLGTWGWGCSKRVDSVNGQMLDVASQSQRGHGGEGGSAVNSAVGVCGLGRS